MGHFPFPPYPISSPHPTPSYHHYVTTTPTGVIQTYRLYHNTLYIYESNETGQHLLDNLQPSSVHLLHIEACTRVGCASSLATQARTLEAPPIGIIGLEIKVGNTI